MDILEIKAAGSNRFVIYPKNDHRPATFTMLNFEVKDIKSEVDTLKNKVITFEQYPEPMKTDKKGIHDDVMGFAIACFKAPAGNILSLMVENR